MIVKQKIIIDLNLFLENFKEGIHNYEVIKNPVPNDASVIDIKISGKTIHIYYEFNVPEEIMPEMRTIRGEKSERNIT